MDATHRVFGIPELVDLVCAQVSLQPDESYGHDGALANLAVLARTSTAIFQSLALDHLWKRQDTILNLLRCMPDDLFDMTEENEDGGIDIRLLRSVTSTDWERPLFYSRRVKSFTQNYMGISSSSETLESLEALSFSLPEESIFPNLQRLQWHRFHPESFYHVRLFLTPRIRELSLATISSFSHLSILSNLAIKSPSLRDVALYMHMSPDTALSAVSTFVCGLADLRSLNVAQVDQTALAHLAHLPELKSLQLRSPSTPEFPVLSRSSPGPVCFPALLSLTMPSVQCTIALFTWSASFTLEKLRIYRAHDAQSPTKIVARKLYAAMAVHCSRLSLTQVDVDEGGDAPEVPTAEEIETYSVGGDALEPLFSFVNLVHISLEHPVGFDLVDSTILQMARSWPRLEHLMLTARPFHHMRSRVTLEALHAFAQHCPNLDTLGLTFDATSVPKIGDSEEDFPQQDCLHALHVSLSPITHPEPVAKFLSALFPGLVGIVTFFNDRLDEHDGEEGELLLEVSVVTSHSLWKDVEDELGHD
ncbi:hypothetical protein FB451DRAFT_1077167 [Mycena latifolia]|nr:hypothetical protein FB451DRAFT_1077167 [Mycena latifolia]